MDRRDFLKSAGSAVVATGMANAAVAAAAADKNEARVEAAD